MSPTKTKAKPPKAPPLLLDDALLEAAVLANPFLSVIPRGELKMLAVPAMLDHYMEQLAGIFKALGHPFSARELELLREKLGARLERGFREHPNSIVTLTYEPTDPPKKGLRCSFQSTSTPTDRNYETWVKLREPPLFGTHPDARVLSVARGISPPARVLDIGAGTGRNSLPLARMGFEVHALEPTASFAAQIRSDAEAEGLAVRVMQADVLDPRLALAPSSYRMAIVVEVVTSHFRDVAQLRTLLARMAELLSPGGLLLFDLFLTRGGYEPTPLVREMSQVVWSNLFTREELGEAMEGLPLRVISEVGEYEYERTHKPPEGWPPTNWYPGWASGRNLFRVSNDGLPVELVWVLCKRI
ncbi:class I SAM-dependent methyltransferase [Tautonia sociabilis]|uniref:Class I SAM-dependent methyltransferase n=1 Tax=Tautonia sociabilis TaxID=2080755 RepID=A0A432MKW1_9BACT|nr:class I SAM-dependent methyltransferase [Tautonia sociabilis]RUL87847.1 class I SAM-dependent methyltransferase [Tautonia sociabilis]